MQTWAILAAKHAALTSGISFGAFSAPGWNSLAGAAIGVLLAGMGIAAVSARRVPSCPLGPAGGQVAAAHGIPAGRWGSRFRRRVDGVLTGMLSDEDDELAAAARSRTTFEESEAAEQGFEASVDVARRLCRRAALAAPRASGPLSCRPAKVARPESGRTRLGRALQWHSRPARELSRALAPRRRRQGAGAFSDSPWFTVSATFDGEQLWPLGNRRPGQAVNRADDDGRVLAAHDLDEYQPLSAAGAGAPR